jgi:hypothetical protein
VSAEAADVSAQTAQPAPQASVHDRMKSFLSGSGAQAAASDQDQSEAGSADDAQAESVSAAPESKQVPAKAEKPADQADDSADEVSDDAQSEDWKPSDLSELLTAAFGEESDKGLDLPVKVKIDGKEGTATLRDLVKSYQLDGHINQKLASLDTDRKAFMADRDKFHGESAQKLLQLDAGIQTLEKVLLGKYEGIDWNKLALEDPDGARNKYFEYQQDREYLSDIGKGIAAEKQEAQQKQNQIYSDWVVEQRNLVLAKTPEWANEATRVKEWAELGAYLETQGFSKEEFARTVDHRQVLVARKAQRWDRLQETRPHVLNKVKAAPKLLKPGTQQSKDAVQIAARDKDRARLRQSGKVQDAVPGIKRYLQSQASQ